LIADYLRAGPVRDFVTLRHALRDRMEEKLPQVQAPALVIRGEHDPIVPQRWAEEVAALLPHGRLAVVRGAAHVVNYSRPDEVARLVTQFFDETLRPAAAGGGAAFARGRLRAVRRGEWSTSHDLL
jgi:pimeloyl-ACP methyl ester carboxylesterase